MEERFRELSGGSMTGTSGKANANVTMTILRAVLNYASLKYEVDGDPLLVTNPVSRLTQARSWHRLPKAGSDTRSQISKLGEGSSEPRKSNSEGLLLCPSVYRTPQERSCTAGVARYRSGLEDIDCPNGDQQKWTRIPIASYCIPARSVFS